jgi:hypothetical protein
MTAAAARRLPTGVFYLLGGPRASSMNVWQVSRSGGIIELTHNPPMHGIDEMSASPAGIAVGDGINYGIQDGTVTAHGVTWLHPWHRPSVLIYGAGIEITDAGHLLYVLAPGQGTDPSSKTFTYWRKASPAGREHQIYSSPLFVGEPLAGPAGQVALVGPSGATAPGQSPGILIISPRGHLRKINPRMAEMGYPVLWGEHAPALAITAPTGRARLVYLNGRQTNLPAGWQPWSWNATGTALLMLKGTMLGIWSVVHPAAITELAHLNPGFQLENVSWLRRPAKIGR